MNNTFIKCKDISENIKSFDEYFFLIDFTRLGCV